MNQLKRILLMILGISSLGLGMLGIVLPVLPTTPFLLLAAYCFLRSSNTLYTWLTTHKVLGKYIIHYLKYKAIKKEAKIMALIMIWTSIPFCIIFLIETWILKVVLFFIALAVSIYILRLSTYREDHIDKDDKNLQKANS